MKIRRLLLAVLVILPSLVPLVVAAQDKYVPKANEELYGTWTNEKTINTFHIQKMVVSADGFKEYRNVSSLSERRGNSADRKQMEGFVRHRLV